MSQRETTSIRLHSDLLTAAQLRAGRLGFQTWTDYVKSLLRYDCLVGGGEHSITAPIARKPLHDQDRIDAQLLELVKRDSGGLRGVYLEHMLERIAEKHEKLSIDDLRRGLDRIDELLGGL